MAQGAQNIRVAIDANSSDLQAACAKAADALKGLGDTVVKQTRLALDNGDMSIRMNGEVAASYERTLATVRATGAASVDSFKGQLAAARDATAGITASQREQQAAYEKTAETAKGSALAATTGAKTEKKAAEDSTAAFGAKSSAITKSGNYIALGLAGVAAVSVDLGLKFERAMTQLQTQAGASEGQVHKLSAAILKMAPTVGATPDQLAGGMYHIVSAMNATIKPAERVSQEMQILRQAAMGAAIGHSNLETTTYALTSAMNALHEPGQKAGKVMSQLNAIVGAGDLRMEELVGALSTGIIPAARTFGISVQSVGAALDTMTQEGTPAQQSATRLRMAITLLGAPSETAAKKLEAIGLASTEVHARTEAMKEALEKAKLSTSKLAADMRQPNGLMVALEDLKKHMQEAGLTSEEQAALISRSFGGGRMGTSILQLYTRLPDMAKNYNNQLKITGQYSEDWKKTQETLSFQWDELKGKAAQLGTELGTDLVPVVKDVLGDVQSLVGWLEKNKTAAEGLAGAFGAFAAVAMGSALFYRIKQIGTVFSEVGGALGKIKPVSMFGGQGGAAAAVTTGIEGARGPEAPGSLMNPVTVAIEAGQYAGLGSLGAEGTVAGETKAAAAETGAVSTAAAENVGGVGIAASLRSTLSTLAGNALRGAGIAGIGYMGAQAAGSAIGGSTGKTVSTVGGDAAIGAGIGTLLGPEGTIAGGVTGALIGGFQKFIGEQAEPKGREIAAKVAAGMGSHVQQQLADELDAVTKRSEGEIKSRFNFNQFMKSGGSPTAPQTTSNMQAMRERENAGNYAVGQRLGGQIVTSQLKSTQGMAGAAQITGLIDYTRQRLEDKQLPEAAKAGALDTITAMVREFEKDKQLPAGSVKEMLDMIHHEFPSLKQYSAAAGAESMGALNEALKGQEVLNTARSLVNQLNTIWPQIPQVASVSASNAVQFFRTNMQTLDTLMHTGPEQQRIAATEAYKKLHDDEIRYFQSMRTGIEGELATLGERVGPQTAAGAQAVKTAFRHMREAIEQEMALGVTATSKGLGEINKLLVLEMKDIGLHPNSPTAKKLATFGPGPSVEGSPGSTPLVKGIKGFAGGGLVQFGRPGDKGRDAIPAMIGAQPVMVGSGEVGAVLTGQQQQVANSYLAPIGGLPGLFSKVSTPHYMASGGIVAPTVPGTGAIPEIVQAGLNKIAGLANGVAGETPTGPSGVPSGPVPSGSVKSWLTQALKITHHFSAVNLAALYGRTMQESTGNPRAINLWDSNAAAGHPSKGLLQTIDSTFDSYRLPGYDDIWNPIDNAVAAIRYMFARYGHIVGPSGSGYERGGIVGAAKGLHITLPKTTAVKPLVVKPKGAKVQKLSYKPKRLSLQSLMLKLGALPEMEDIRALAPFEKNFNTLTSEQNLLSSMEGNPDGVSILPADMKYLTPTLQPGELLRPYMSTTQAERVHQQTVGADGENEQLGLQGQLIQWISGLDDHRLLSGTDVSLLAPTFKGGLPLKAGYPIFEGERWVIEAQENQQKAMVRVQDGIASHAKALVAQRKRRIEVALKAAAHYAKRARKLEADLRAMTTGSLKQREAAAKSSTRIAEQKAASTESVDYYETLIAGEKEKAKPDTSLIATYNKRIAEEHAFSAKLRAPSSTVSNAELAVRKNALTDEIHALKEDEKRVSGGSNTVGTGGLIGTLRKEVTTLNTGIGDLHTKISESLQGTIPGLRLDWEGIAQSMKDAAESVAPVIAPGTGQSTELTSLLEARNTELSESLGLANAQFSVLKGVVPQIPKFEHGGIVANTGLALVHAGEAISPSPKGPYGSQIYAQAAQPVSPTIELHQHFSGGAGELMGMIDHRIAAKGAQIISPQMGRRSRMLTAAPGGR